MSTQLVIVNQDGSKTVVQTTLEDRLAFETALRRNKSWGKLENSSLKLQPFLAWNAAVRAGSETRSWEEFTTGDTAAANVEQYDPEADTEDDELEVEGVGKDTPQAPSTTSPLSSAESSAAPRGSGAAKKARS